MANWPRPSDGDVKRMATLEVRNLPCYIANGADAEDLMEDLKTLFGRYGDIGDIFTPEDKRETRTGKLCGFALVRYYNKKDAEDALDELNGRKYNGRKLKIKFQGPPALQR